MLLILLDADERKEAKNSTKVEYIINGKLQQFALLSLLPPYLATQL